MSASLQEEYAMATEWNLATLEEMVLIKSTSASRIRRQRDICAKMLGVCAPFTVSLKKVGRTWRALDDMTRGETATHWLDRLIRSLRGGQWVG